MQINRRLFISFFFIKWTNYLALVVFVPFFAFASTTTLADNEVKQKIIKRSIANYHGSCACPYQYDKAGRRCGKRSAWYRKGGHAPLCYPNDVTPRMVEEFRRR